MEPTLQALARGYHVLLEKPMATTARDCIALVGDEGVLLDFVRAVQTGAGETLTSARNSLESHLIAFAAEESRLCD